MSHPIIDSHQHVWDPQRAEYPWLTADLAPINRTVRMDELLPEMRAAGVAHTILVQSADDPEDTGLMRDTAAAHPEVVGIVGFAPLDDPAETARTIAAWAGDSLMVGVRTLIHNQADPDWLLRAEVDESLGLLEEAGLPFDVVAVLPRHLELVPIIAERHPELRMVIDHLAKPPIGSPSNEPWYQLIARAAAAPMVFGKVSGLYAAGDDADAWTPSTVQPFVDRAVEQFGPERLMFGSDWPVSVLAGGYTRVWGGLTEVLSGLDTESREQILGRTAAEFYKVDPGRITDRV